MAYTVASARYEIDDAASAAADKITQSATDAADALTQLGTTVDTTSQKVTRATSSAQSLANRLDPVTKATNDLSLAQARLAAAQATMSAAMDKGFDQGTAATVLQNLSNRVADARDKLNALTAANTATTNSLNVSGQTWVILAEQAHKAADMLLSGGSAVKAIAYEVPNMVGVLGGASNAWRVLTGVLSGPGGYIAAALATTAAAAELVSYSESQAHSLATLSHQIQATRSDYAALAAQANAAATSFQAGTGNSLTDTRTAAGTLESAGFNGTTDQLQNLLSLSDDISKIFNTSLPDGAEKVAAALRDPAAVADQMAKQNLPSMSAALAHSVDMMEMAGDRSQALNVVLQAMHQQYAGAADAVTPLDKALRGMSEAFHAVGADGKSFAQALGDEISGLAAHFVNAGTDIISTLNKLHNFYTQPSPGANDIMPGHNVVLGPAVNGEQAVGIFQVMPSTAQSVNLGANIYDPDQNIKTGLSVLDQKYGLAHGNVDQTLALYGGYGNNTSAAASYIGKVNSADVSKLPTDVAGQIQYWGQALNLPPDLVALGERIAMVESGGHQFTDSKNSFPIPVGNDIATQNGVPVHSAAPLAGIQTADQQLQIDNQFVKLQESTPSTNETSEKLQAEIALIEKYKTAHLDSASAIAAANEQEQKRVGLLNDNLSPQEKMIRSLDDAAASTAGLTEGDQKLVALQQQMAELDRSHPDTAFTDAQKVQAVNALLEQQSNAYKQVTNQIDLQTGNQNDLAKAYETGYGAVADVIAQQQAYDKALQLFPQHSAQFSASLAPLTQHYKDLAQATNDAHIAQQTLDNKDQLEYLQAETSSLGENDDARNVMLAHLKAEQELRKLNISELSDEGQKYLQGVDAISAQTAALQHYQDSLNEIGSFGEKAFDDITQAITQATVSGEGQAIKFSNIWRSVLSEISAEALKLTIVNPVESMITGKSLPTLTSVTSAMTGSGGATTNLSGVTSLSSALPGDVWGGSGATITGSNGTASTSGISGVATSTGNSGSLLNTIWNTQLWGGSSSVSVDEDPWAGAGTDYGSGVLSTGGATVGQAVTGVGVGYGVGSTVGSLIAGSNANKQLNSEIGAATGAIAGAAIGSIIPGVGTVIGGLVGGLVGGTAGGLIGPTEHHYSNISISTQNGMLSVGNSLSQLVDNSQQLAEAEQEVDQINALFEKYNLRAMAGDGTAGDATTGVINIGGNIKGLKQYGSLDDALSVLDIQSLDPNADPRMNEALKNPNNVTSFDQLDALVTLYGTTIPNLLDSVGKLPSSYDDQIKSLSDNYGGAIGLSRGFGEDNVDDIQAAWDAQVATLTQKGQEQAGYQVDAIREAALQSYGGVAGQGQAQLMAFDDSAAQQKTQLDSELVDELGNAVRGTSLYSDAMQTLATSLDQQREALEYQIQTAQKAAQDAISQQDESLWARDAAAHGDTTTSTMDNFDISAEQQRAQMTAQLVAAYGEQITQTDDYTQQMALLNMVLADERQAQLDSLTEQHNAAVTAANENDMTIQARYLAATGDQEGADLLNWKVQAEQEMDQFTQTLVNTFGDAYTQTADYAARVTALQTTQQAEYAAIVQKYTDQAAEAANGVVTNLSSYVDGLLTGSDSGLSAQDQLAAARSQFEDTAAAATGGDYTALTELQGYAETYRADAQAVYGSGTGYADTVTEIANALQPLAAMTTDQLTASYQASLVQNQTDILDGSLGDLKTLLTNLITEYQQQTRAILAKT